MITEPITMIASLVALPIVDLSPNSKLALASILSVRILLALDEMKKRAVNEKTK
jgi:hypothetical protein